MRKDAQTSRNRPIQKRQRVELQFLESLHSRLPTHAPTLEALGHLYTKFGRYEEGLKIDESLTRLKPDEPEVWYNLSCSYALLGKKEEAFRALEKAVSLGYRDFEWIAKDPDLKSLHGDPRLKTILIRVLS